MTHDDDELNDWGVPIKDDGYHWTWQQQQLWSAIRVIEIRKEKGWDTDGTPG